MNLAQRGIRESPSPKGVGGVGPRKQTTVAPPWARGQGRGTDPLGQPGYTASGWRSSDSQSLFCDRKKPIFSRDL